MNLEKIGTLFKNVTKPRIWWVKLGVSLVLSNLFFFLLFGGVQPVTPSPTKESRSGWISVQLEAELQTPFQTGKKVLLVNRARRIKVEGVLEGEHREGVEKLAFAVREKDAAVLFLHRNWEILPYLRDLTFTAARKEPTHEIYY